jgi:anti-anti-sigma factor
MAPESRISEHSTDQCPVCGHEVKVDPASPLSDGRCSYCGHLVWFRKQEEGDFLLVELMTTMDPEHADFEPVGGWILRSDGPRRVLISFAHVEFVSSTFLGRLLALQRKLKGGGRELTLCRLNQVVREIFQITKLEDLFNFSEDQDGAARGL